MMSNFVKYGFLVSVNFKNDGCLMTLAWRLFILLQAINFKLKLENLENLIKTHKSSGARSDERKSVASCPLLILGELQELRVRETAAGESQGSHY